MFNACCQIGLHDMQCWVCGSNATTGEHLPKASNLRDLFGEIPKGGHLFHSSERQINRFMQSTNSKLVKLNVLCIKCNSSVSQPFDQAWDELWAHLNLHEATLKTGSIIHLSRVFRNDTKIKMVNLHLYAVKLFGCVAAAFSIPLDLAGMGNAILQRQPYSNVNMGLGKKTWLKMKSAGPTDVDVCRDNSGRCVFAVWCLNIGTWDYQFIYAVPGQKRNGMLHTWHPSRSSCIRLKDFPTLNG